LKVNGPMINDRTVRFELTRSAPMARTGHGGGDRDRRPSSFRGGRSGGGGHYSDRGPRTDRSERSSFR